MASFSELQELHEQRLDPKRVLESFFRMESEFHADSVQRIFDQLNKCFSSGGVKGKTLTQLSVGPLFQYLFLASDYFTEIIIGGSTDKCISEIEKWRTNAPGAVDCSHAAKLTCELQGNRDTWTEKQNTLQSKIKDVLKYDVSKSNPFSPTTVPPADCLFLKHCLECHTTTIEGFCSALNNVSTLLKKGGTLIMMTCLEQTYFMVDTFRFPNLSISKESLETSIIDAGFVIEETVTLPRTVQRSYDIADYKAVMYVKAKKK